MLSERSKRGISEVLGAMLLMIVVVAAVASFSLFLSYTQQQSQNRQNFLTSVKNDDLQIASIQLSPKIPIAQYNMTCTSSKYYVQIVTSTSVNLVDQSTGVSSLANLFSSLSPKTVAYFNSINFNTTFPDKANLFTSGSPWSIVFVPTGGDCSFASLVGTSHTWAKAIANVRNLNTQASGISAIQVDGIYLSNSWYVVNSSGFLQPEAYNTSARNPLYLGAKANLNVQLNLSSLAIPMNGAMQIVLGSTAGNFFQTSYGAPTAVTKESVAIENLQITTRDVPEFDGSGSTGGNGSFISSYVWRIQVPTTKWNGSWSDTSNIVTAYASGVSFQYRPESFFSSSQLSTLYASGVGPIMVTQTVVDSNGLVATSQSTVFGPDANIVPNTNLFIVKSNTQSYSGTQPGEVTIEVNSVIGQVSQNVPVYITIDTPATIAPATGQSLFGSTNSTGEFSFFYIGTGVIQLNVPGIAPLTYVAT